MTPAEALQAAREVKGLLVLEDPQHADLMPSLLVIRAGASVARLMVPGRREQMLPAAFMASAAFGADALIAVNDAFVATEKLLDERGEPERGQMERLWEKGRTDLVQEVLALSWVNREAEAQTMIAPYRVVAESRSVEWDEPWEPPETGGPYIEGLQAAMRELGERDVIAHIELAGIPDLMGLSPEAARAHGDVAAAKYLTTTLNIGVFLMVRGEEAAAVVDRSLRHDPSINWQKL